MKTDRLKTGLRKGEGLFADIQRGLTRMGSLVADLVVIVIHSVLQIEN
ncbi:MAG: hypothetical protein ACYSWO_19395 [Planctomycetota bacterium]